MLLTKHGLRALVFVFAFVGALLGISSPALAQSNMLYGGWCGQISWSNGTTSDTWFLFLQNQGWSSSLTSGNLGGGSYSLSGSRITFRGDDAPRNVINATISGERITGTVTNDNGQRGTFAIAMLHPPGGARASSPLPPDFSPDAAQRALTGERDQLASAVTWGWTQQGSEYWRSVYQGSGPLPAAARAALQDWITRYNRNEQPRCDYRLLGAGGSVAGGGGSGGGGGSLAGSWTVHVVWGDGQAGDTSWDLRSDGSFQSRGGDAGTWSQSGNRFTSQFTSGEARCRYNGAIRGDTISGEIPATPDCFGGTFSMTRSGSGGSGGGGQSWRAIAGDWQLIQNLRGNTCSRYYRFTDRGDHLQWYTGDNASSLGEQTSGGNFRDMGGGRIFYDGYDDQYFQIVGGQLVRTDARGTQYCTFRRVR